jgi:hypothetical protein
LFNQLEESSGIPPHENIKRSLEKWTHDILNVQARRREELTNSESRQRFGHPRVNDEKDIISLSNAINELSLSTREIRTTLWCFLQITLNAKKQPQQQQVELPVKPILNSPQSAGGQSSNTGEQLSLNDYLLNSSLDLSEYQHLFNNNPKTAMTTTPATNSAKTSLDSSSSDINNNSNANYNILNDFSNLNLK